MSEVEEKAHCIFHPERDARTRDLCETCYVLASRKVSAGETTWNELVEHGLCGPTLTRRRGKKPGPFLQAFERMKAEMEPLEEKA